MQKGYQAMPEARTIVQIDALLAPLIPDFLAHRQEDFDFLRRSLDENHFEAIADMAHRLKGTLGCYGFLDGTPLAIALEGSAKAQDPEGVRRGISELVAYFERIDIVYFEASR